MLRQNFNQDWKYKKITSQLGEEGEEIPVILPHDALTAEKRTLESIRSFTSGYYSGGLWCYTKQFYLEESYQNKVVYLEFEGVASNASVLVNGESAAHWPSPYTDYTIKLDRYLKYGTKNEIKVFAKLPLNTDSRWYTGGGIYRNVKILTGEFLHIEPDGVRIRTPQVASDIAMAEVETEVALEGGESKTIQVYVEIYDDEKQVVASSRAPLTIFPGETKKVRQNIYLKQPKLWSPDSPTLYSCKVTLCFEGLEGDSAYEQFGFRKLTLDPQYGLRINGETVNLRGACIHHDNGVIGSRSIERAEERRVEILKSAGFNALRSCHHPMSKELLEACDRLGMLVMDEAFDVWRLSKTHFDYSLYFDQWWEFDIEQMIKKDFNHPSVIIYSIGNEISETCLRGSIDIGRSITNKIKSLDQDRYVLNSVNGMRSVMAHLYEIAPDYTGEAEIITVMTNMKERLEEFLTHPLVSAEIDESLSIVDIAGYNYMAERYENDAVENPNRMVVGSETYPDGIAECWKKVEKLGNVIGDFTYVGWDYIGESGVGKLHYGQEPYEIFGPYPWYLAWMGDIDITGYRRPISYWRETVWGLRKKPYLAVYRPEHYGEPCQSSLWSWSDTISSWKWPGFEGSNLNVDVYSDAEEIELFLNGISLGRKPCGETVGYITSYDLKYEPGILEAVAYNQNEEQSREQLKSGDNTTKLHMDCDRRVLKCTGGDLAYIRISVVDSQNIPYMGQERQISIEVTGAGELIGFGSADPKSEEVFTDSKRTTFEGSVLAVIRPLDCGGEICVRAETEDCDSEAICLQVQE